MLREVNATIMTRINPQFIVNDKGDRTGVVLDIAEFEQLLDAYEDQCDAADLDQAIALDDETLPYEAVRDELQ